MAIDENYPIPVPKENEVLIAVRSVGICGSDIHFWVNGGIGGSIVKKPIVLGHESSGIVIEVGLNVTGLKPGDRVAIEPGIPCRICENCKLGRYNICPDIKFCGTPHTDGTLCRFFVHPDDYCFKLPDHVTFEEGALLEPLSVAVHACKRAGILAGHSVLICGAGPIGLVHIMTSKAMGATQICVTDISDSRLKIAKEVGAQFCINVLHKDVNEIAECVENFLNKNPDITLECSGAKQSINLGIQATKVGGTMVLIGLGETEMTVPLIEVALKEIIIKGSLRFANCYQTALDLVASGAVDLKPLITHRFKLENILDAFETSRDAAGGAIKVIIQCS